MKTAILQTIYDVFASWSDHLEVACRRGCSSCCTKNVTLTALEAEQILDYLLAHGMTDWAVPKMAPGTMAPPGMTTNEFAAACLQGKAGDDDPQQDLAPCPFLENNECRIYPARPFACRLFVSTTRCKTGQPASIPDYYLEAATAVSQLIEHLGQKEYWGLMGDVLCALLDISRYRAVAERLPTELHLQAKLRTRTARPLPGFLLSEENIDRITPLIKEIFQAEVGGKSIEDILNGR